MLQSPDSTFHMPNPTVAVTWGISAVRVLIFPNATTLIAGEVYTCLSASSFPPTLLFRLQRPSMSINLLQNTLLNPEPAARSSIATQIAMDFSGGRVSAPKTKHLSSLAASSILKRKHSAVLNLLAGTRQNLHHQPSKLDLIDGTTLTSLPLPPPPKIRLRRQDLASSANSRDSTLDALATYRNNSNSTITSENGVTTLDDLVDENVDITFCSEADETFEETEDPIVLVEDYMASTGDAVVDRKQSLVNFKRRLYSDSLSVLTTRICNKRTISEDSEYRPHNAEDLEAIFGKIPGADKLKHCCLCDKPLYEISSIINNEHTNLRKNINELYNEFVCWDCINVYEQFLGELYQSEVLDAQLPPTCDTTTEKLLTIFNTIRNTYDNRIAEPPRKQIRNAFSSDLLGRLHLLSSMSSKDNEAEWLKNLRYKLRWRWRINGLIPNSFSSDRQVQRGST